MTTRLCTSLPRAGEFEQQKKQQEKNREKKKEKEQRREQSFKALSLYAASWAVCGRGEEMTTRLRTALPRAGEPESGQQKKQQEKQEEERPAFRARLLRGLARSWWVEKKKEGQRPVGRWASNVSSDVPLGSPVSGSRKKTG